MNARTALLAVLSVFALAGTIGAVAWFLAPGAVRRCDPESTFARYASLTDESARLARVVADKLGDRAWVTELGWLADTCGGAAVPQRLSAPCARVSGELAEYRHVERERDALLLACSEEDA